ncbi:MAG: hypothetical protein EBU14_14505, partial [Acetobacteraceae bacterium]|nr:hypothetical protein [Acetobacteraceae bacterium]
KKKKKKKKTQTLLQQQLQTLANEYNQPILDRLQKAVETVAGPDEELGDNARARLQRLREVLAVRPQRAA